MCFAIPRKVVEIDGNKVVIDYQGEKKEAYNLLNAEKGNYVIVKGGVVVQKISEKEAEKIFKMIENKIETPEEVFFKYSFSCAEDLLNIGMITSENHMEIESLMEKGEIPPRSSLESWYPNALSRITNLSKRLETDKWDTSTIRRYFLNEHNRIIDNEEGLYKGVSKTIKDNCKVRVGTVKKKITEGPFIVYYVEFEDKNEKVIGKYFPDAEIGDRISVHWRFAIEKIPYNYETDNSLFRQ